MNFSLDTNTCIKFLNGTSNVIKNKISSTNPEDIVLCSVVKAELFYGASKSERPQENIQKVHYFTGRFISLPFDDQASEIYGQIRSRLEKKGQLIGPNDLLIASIALANSLTLVTHNTKEFMRVENLKIVDWEVK